VKNTIATPLSERLLKDQGDVLPFLNKEIVPLNREFRSALNFETTQLLRGVTTGNGVAVALWISDAIPTDSSWRVKADVIGRTATGGEQASYGRVALFTNEGGVVSQVGATVALWTLESAAGCDCTLAVLGQTVILSCTDDGMSAMDWKILVSILPTDEV
jgi:hypothetical protein